ncbi:MAG: amidoligase family protein [Dysgonamonadaceae bacterium]|jgi:hypothetical protein|nr:amidoligase family protein [Dysgonamonadaceae bacterium]
MNERIKNVLTSTDTNQNKRKSLVEIGLTAREASRIINDYDKSRFVTAGVEIECFNVKKEQFIQIASKKGVAVVFENYNHKSKNHFKVVSDSSISGGADGNCLEVVTPVLKSERDLNKLQKVCDALNEAGAKVNKTCGLHVHIGLQNVDDVHYKNVFVNYYYLEGVIDKFMSKSRRANDNIYCKSLKTISVESIKATADRAEISNLFRSDRYFKLNPVSYLRHNTLEFRQHQGTTDPDKIAMWLRFVILLIEFSKLTQLTEPVTEISAIPFITESDKQYFINRAATLA